jgi:hypothetical protein
LGFGGAFAASAIIVGQLIQKQEGCAFDDSTVDEGVPTQMQSLIYQRVIGTRRNILWQHGIPHDAVASTSISPIHVPLDAQFQLHHGLFCCGKLNPLNNAGSGNRRKDTELCKTILRNSLEMESWPKSKFDKTIYTIDLFVLIKLRSFDKTF